MLSPSLHLRPVFFLLSLFLFYQFLFFAPTSFLLSSVFFEATHLSLLLSLCLFLTTTYWSLFVSTPAFLCLHTSRPYLYNSLHQLISITVSSLRLSLCTVCSLMFAFFLFHMFHPDWILPVAQLHLYKKAYILGYTLSTELPSPQNFLFCRITLPSYVRTLTTITLHTHIIVPLFSLSHRPQMRYMKKIGTMQVCKKMTFKLHGHLLAF